MTIDDTNAILYNTGASYSILMMIDRAIINQSNLFINTHIWHNFQHNFFTQKKWSEKIFGTCFGLLKRRIWIPFLLSKSLIFTEDSHIFHNLKILLEIKYFEQLSFYTLILGFISSTTMRARRECCNERAMWLGDSK